MGLIRKAIIIGGAFMAMPSPPAQVGNQMAFNQTASSWAYISAASETVADFKGFCDRKPQVCGTAQYLAVTIEGKAKYSARMIYDWANESSAGVANKPTTLQELANSDPILTGSTDLRLTTDISENSTLNLNDLVPEWRGSFNG